MNRRIKIGIMIALLVLAVGFAAVTTTLIINGTLTIASDQAGFDKDVIFTKAKTNGKAYIIENGKTIEFTADLKDIGEEADLRYEITNKNRQYDASGTIECDFADPDNRLNEYITITPSPESFDIEASRKKTGHVVVRMVRSYIGSETSSDDNDPVNIGEIGFKCTIKLEAGERENLAPEVVPIYTDSTLNGADPKVGGDLIPVTIAENGTVTYADEYEEWYNYRNKQWANAVMLVDGQSFKYDTGDVIKEEDIESYFVWIPRYKYKLWNVDGTNVETSAPETSNARSIEIMFETNEDAVSTGTQNGEWLTHPAFTNFDVNGIWVGKYETGVKDVVAGDPNDRSKASIGTTDVSKIVIKPGIYAWRASKLAFFFYNGYEYNRALDSHMMKNTEWGAVAYLSHSQYGVDGEVTSNNYSMFGTGFGGPKNTWTNDINRTFAYNTAEGVEASTTGNVTGVYDMAGGIREYVAAYVENGSMSGQKFKNGDLEAYAKYFDVYKADSTATSYENRILGDATGELGNFYTYTASYRDATVKNHSLWYSDVAIFPSVANAWFVRGGGAKEYEESGIFAFNSSAGMNAGDAGFRIVLSPQ